MVCCQRHLDIASDISDKVRTAHDAESACVAQLFHSSALSLRLCQVGQARALYNFGNVYHAKGKSICWSGAEPGDFPEEVMTALRKAAEYYE